MPNLDDILHRVSKPARYTGGEWNSVIKDWATTSLKFALAYPDVYEIGMSNMALPILYHILNSQPDVLAERVFAPWRDMEDELKTGNIPLFSLESRHPLEDFNVIGFSLGYELTYTNVLNMLHLAGIPLLASQRDKHPLVIAGGGCVLNPEPMADFIDLFVIGDGEEILLELLDCLREGKKEGANRVALLHRAATIAGIYVPGLYQAEYEADGLFRNLTPLVSEASESIERRIVPELPPPPTHPVVPYIEVAHDRGAVEIQRGCSHGCRFCQAGMVYRPVRRRPPAEVLAAVDELTRNCGYDEVSLVSLSSSDYPAIEELVASLTHRYRDSSLAVSLPSLRFDTFSIELMDALPSGKKTGLTFAPEAGSERLRRSINKNLSEEDLQQTAVAVFARGWTNLKLYFMLGLPGETETDIEGIIHMVTKLQQAGGKTGGKRPQLRVSLANFVPKAHTPFQWVAQEDGEQLRAKHAAIRQGLKKGIRVSWTDPEVSLLEAALSRGDRRLGGVILRAWELGSTFDAWSESFNFQRWLRAFADSNLDMGFYAQRQRHPKETLPWGHIDTGISPAFLKREYQRALAGKETPDCREQGCSSCGLEKTQSDCRQKHQGLSQSRR